MTADNHIPDKGSEPKGSNRVTFACHACGRSMSAAVADIGRRVNCPDCGAANSVPLPKIKVGGGQRSRRPVGAPSKAAAAPRPAEKPEPVAPTDPDAAPELVASPAEDATPKPTPAAPQSAAADEGNATAAKEVPANEAAPAPAPESPPPAAATDTIPSSGAAQTARAATPTMAPTPDKAQPIAAIMLLLVVTAAIGWAAVSWGPGLLASLTRGGDGGAVVIEAPTPQVTIGPDQLQNLVGLWKASQIARRTIDSDLKVSLAEFEARGMVDAAATVRTAISQKQDDIEALRQRFSAIMIEIASVYADQPAAIEGLYENFMASQAIRSDPEALQLLQMSAEAVKTSPPNSATYNLYFE